MNAHSITALVGTDDNPGVVNAIYSPRVFVLSPYTSEWDRAVHQITTTLRYQDRASSLATKIAGIIPGSGTPFSLGYTRTSAQASTADSGIAGRAILEVDPFQSWLVSSEADASADSAGLQVGHWRPWVEDQLITYQDVWAPWTLALKRKRDATPVHAVLVFLATPLR